MSVPISVTVTVGCPPRRVRAAAHGYIAGQPINAGSSPAGVTVRVEDAIGQLVTNSTAAVSVSIASGPGTLFGTTSANAGRGGHVLDLAIDLAGTYTLLAQSAPLTSATSNSFVITGGPGSAPDTVRDHTGHATADDVTVGAVSVPVGRASVLLVSLDEGTGTFCEGACTGNTISLRPAAQSGRRGHAHYRDVQDPLPGTWTTFGSSSWPTTGPP